MSNTSGITEHMLRHIVQNAYSIIIAADIDSNRYTAMVYKSLSGTWPDSYEGDFTTLLHMLCRVIHPDDLPTFTQLTEQAASSRQVAGKTPVSKELLHICGFAPSYYETEAIQIHLSVFDTGHSPCLFLISPLGNQTKLQERFETLLNNIKGGVICCRFAHNEKQLETVYMNNGWEELTGYSMREMQELFNNNPKMLIVEEDRKQADDNYLSQLRTGNTYELQYKLRRKDGLIIWIMDKGMTSTREDGYTENQSILTDVTMVKEQEEQLRISDKRFRVAIQATGSTVYEFDLKTKQYIHFENAQSVFGMNNEETLRTFNEFYKEIDSSTDEKPVNTLLHPNDRSLYKLDTEKLLKEGTSVFEARLQKNDGSYIWCAVHRALITGLDNQPMRVVGTISDIDLSKKYTEKLTRQIQTEPLTGLTNKPAAVRIISDILKKKGKSLHVLMALDIDNFKGINDTMGHTFGDTVLIDVSQKLKKLFRSGDIVARTGGDEFIVFMPDVPSREVALEKARVICAAVRYTYMGEIKEYKISCSLGLVFSTGGDTFESMFEKADIAMYDSKSDGKDRFSVYEDNRKKLGTLIRRDIRREQEIRSATLNLNERIFTLLYGTEDFTGSVNMVLALLGRYANVSRSYVFENTPDGSYVVNTFEWCNEGIAPMIQISERIVLNSGSDFYAVYNNDGVFHCENNALLPPQFRTLAVKRNIKTVTQIAIREDGKFRGFIGFDYCTGGYGKTVKEQDSLIFASKILGTFVLKRRAEEAMLQSSKNKIHAMDNMPSPVYVIDEHFTLQYFNKETQRIVPTVSIGANCHTLFMNNGSPCTGCPAKSCGDGTAKCELINPLGMHLIVSATKIFWSGKPMVLLACQDFTCYIRQ